MSRLERPELFQTEGIMTSPASVYARQMLPEPIMDLVRSVKERNMGIPQKDPFCLEMGGVEAHFWIKSRSDARIMHALKGEGAYGNSLIKTVSAERGTFVDIGCAQGLYTIPAALTGADVIGIDPDIRMITALNKNMIINPSANGKIQTLSVALGKEKTVAQLYTDERKTYAASLFRNIRKQTEVVNVPVLPYDLLVETGKIPSDAAVVKIDVEGAEGQVIQGMENTLSSQTPPKHLFMEFHTLYINNFGHDPYALFDYIINSGYELAEEPIKRRFEVLCHFKHL